MYTIKVQLQFSSAHKLRGYKGKCEELHGHNWRVEVCADSDTLDEVGMVMDFKELKKILNEVLEVLDHKHLNDIEYFKDVNPTSENIARYISEIISERKPGISIGEVTVWETDTACATYSRGRE